MENKNIINKIVKIEKSEEKQGFCKVYLVPKNDYSEVRTLNRKCYDRKTGKFKNFTLINLNTNIISFTWNSDGEAENVSWVGCYSSIEEAEQDTNTKDFEAPKKPEAPKTPTAPTAPTDGKVRHVKYPEILACIQEKIPVYLAGPAGSGKNHVLEQVAEDMGLDFYFTNSVQQEFKITGFIDAGGIYHETEFYKAFKNGGLFFLDELDASIPEVLVLLNAAIANGYFEFPNGRITAHKDFRVVAAGNTVGQGADDQYTGRMVLDQATLDRFAIIEFDYDTRIEMMLAKHDKELVNFIHDLRAISKQQGIRATFSYRCIKMVVSLKTKLPIATIFKIVVFKGMDNDTIRTMNKDNQNNIWWSAFRKFKQTLAA